MIKTIIAIGGGEIGRIKTFADKHSEQKPIETMTIDKKIIELTGKEHPTLVFIGAASGDDPKYITAVRNHFEKRLGCHVIDLALTPKNDLGNIQDVINHADIIYVGGGSPTKLMNALNKTGTGELLKGAYNKGVIMSGNSAGGCVWFATYDNEDEEDFDGTVNTLKLKPGLGLVKGYFVPHWNTKAETGLDTGSIPKDEIVKLLVKESESGYAVDEGAAIMVQTDDSGRQTITKIKSKTYDVIIDGSGREIITERASQTEPQIYTLNHTDRQYINPGKKR